ncbi:alcohol oxidase [Ceratobasidium sp. AG-I]|nr:alcohol oxidase [Ceratobasidium sp. AG-I]
MRRTCTCSALLLLSSAAALARVSPRSLTSDGADFSAQIFDYIIVGGGTAGLAVAARLSENPKNSVGVVDAGQYLVDDPLIDTPRSAGALQGNAKYDWLFKSAPQPNLNGRVLDLPRGKVLGGSSAINLMVFNRASKAEYDTWAQLGNSGWNWDGLLPYMKAAEKFTGIDPFRVNSTTPESGAIYPTQGRTGPIAASYNSWYSDTVDPYDKTMTKLNVSQNFNPDSGDPYGLYNSATAVNRTTGKRSYAASTYYAYNAGRPNFVVLTGAQATKINFSNTTKGGKITATGVTFVSNSTNFSVTARKEVILSAGSFQSPQLLELSGIGNSTILKQYGITPLVDLPGVGENLQDHAFVATSYELKPGATTLDILRNDPAYNAAALAQYASTHDGMYASSVSTVSFINLESFVNKTKIKSMTAQLDKEIASGTTPLQKAQYIIQKGYLKQKIGHIEVVFYPGYFGSGVPKANTSYVSMLMIDQHPFSRGNVHIGSADPLVKATPNPNYFSKTFDQDTLVEAVKFGLTISKTEPLASLIVARQDPAPNVTSDADITNYVKTYLRTIHHPIGTAALASRLLGGVVDSNLKVYGTTNVRVVDASVIPLHVGTHLSRTVYGIGEKAAAIIKSGN